MRWISRLSFVAVAVLLGAGTRVYWTPEQHAQEPPRKFRRSAGTPLAQRIHPGEPQVLVDGVQSPPMIVQPPPGMSLISWRLQNGFGVIVLEVEKAASHLTPEQDWVETTLTGTVSTILRNVDPPLSVGERVTFDQDGGTVSIGPTKVTGVLNWQRSFQPSARYLVFVSREEDGQRLAISALRAYRILENGALEQMTIHNPTDEVTKLGLNATIAAVQDWVRGHGA